MEEAFAPQSVIIHLADDVDISRGDLIALSTDAPKTEQELQVLLCWMDTKPLIPGNKYLLQINSRLVRAAVREIDYRLDVNTLQQEINPQQAQLNDVIRVTIKTASPVSFDTYRELRASGGAILIDETSHVTVGACMIQ